MQVKDINKKALLSELLKFRKFHEDRSIPEDVLGAEPYAKIIEKIQMNGIIVEANPLWDEISNLVLHWSPDFKRKLILLTEGKISLQDYRLALLIKLGIRPTDISLLIGKARGTVNSRRQNLGLKLFGEKKSMKLVDKIISLL